MVKYSKYESFEQAKVACRECPIGPIYDCVVPSYGNKKNPKVMIIGEAPGREEVQQLQPFVGKSGKLLREVLNKFGFRTENAIISNTIPCRPKDNKFPTDNSIVTSCTNKWLFTEISILKPRLLLLIGAKPLYFVAERSGITKSRGTIMTRNISGMSIKMLATYHPSYVLRKQYMNDGDEIRKAFEADIELASSYLEN